VIKEGSWYDLLLGLMIIGTLAWGGGWLAAEGYSRHHCWTPASMHGWLVQWCAWYEAHGAGYVETLGGPPLTLADRQTIGRGRAGQEKGNGYHHD
jgi:hypothetical protein